VSDAADRCAGHAAKGCAAHPEERRSTAASIALERQCWATVDFRDAQASDRLEHAPAVRRQAAVAAGWRGKLPLAQLHDHRLLIQASGQVI
jgi:hypothetical protein